MHMLLAKLFYKRAGPLLADKRADTRETSDRHRQPTAPAAKNDKERSRRADGGGSKEERRGREEERRKKEEARRSREEKVAKYSHLPVYNKEEEQRKAREREARLAQLFSGT